MGFNICHHVFSFGLSAQVLKSTMEKSYNVSINKATWKVIVKY
jgi:hypothetical protein